MGDAACLCHGCVVTCAFARTNPSHRQLATRLSVACTSLSAICHTLSYSLSTLSSLAALFLSSFPLHPPPLFFSLSSLSHFHTNKHKHTRTQTHTGMATHIEHAKPPFLIFTAVQLTCFNMFSCFNFAFFSLGRNSDLFTPHPMQRYSHRNRKNFPKKTSNHLKM